MDIGCSVDRYAADFTRTLPVGGRFTPEARQLYSAVLAAQREALASCEPGMRLAGTAGKGEEPTLEDLTRSSLADAGVDSKYPHGVGHTVGLFVHDTMSEPRARLAPNMVITLEPGLYLKGKLGIRIEDTYFVTDAGCVPLTTGFPADPDVIEALMKSDGGFADAR